MNQNNLFSGSLKKILIFGDKAFSEKNPKISVPDFHSLHLLMHLSFLLKTNAKVENNFFVNFFQYDFNYQYLLISLLFDTTYNSHSCILNFH